MKLLHTADWHLGDRLGRIDRTADLRRQVERIAQYCREERVDVLLVAGDIFSEMLRADGLREAIGHLKETFEEFVRDGGTILAVTGNHDNAGFCQMLQHAMNLAAPTLHAPGTVVPPGRLYLASEPTLLHLADRATGGVVQFILMPYPTPDVYLTNEALQKYRHLEEKKQFLQAAFISRLNALRSSPEFDSKMPAVLAA